MSLTISRAYVDSPNHSESLGGRSLLSLGDVVHVCIGSL
jgi:hypothetical protein